MEFTKHEPLPERSSDRTFGLLFAAIFAGVAFWPLPEGSVRVWSLLVGLIFLVLALGSPGALSWLNLSWMRFGLLLNRIVSPVAIGIVYYLALVPTALLMRVFGKLPLHLDYDPKADSYWIPRNPAGPDPKTMIDQF